MFASIANISIPAHINLVATPLPNSVALRVPSTNVSPTISSAQIDNNASGNSNFIPQKTTASSLAIPLQTSSAFSAQNYVLSGTSGGAVQAGFLAQLASGDSSPEVDKIFVQYEKLVKYSTVKYKPSDAGKPEDAASSFSSVSQKTSTNPSTDKEIAKNTKQPITEQQPAPELVNSAKAAYKEAATRNQNI